MCASNWVGDNRDISPHRNNEYQLDNVGLQLGLNLPIQVLVSGMSVVGDYRTRQHFIEPSNWMGLESTTCRSNTPSQLTENSIIQTVDGIPVRKVYVTNISIDVQRQEIYNTFSYFGRIRNVYLGVSKVHNNKQFAFITFDDPKVAAKVLHISKFHDRGRYMYVAAADSWHQPQEGPDGQIIWKVDRKAEAKQETESEEDDDQAMGAVGGEVATVEANEESLNALNDDCLLHIFSFLSYKEILGIERVCKRWQGLSFRMWRCLHQLNFAKPPFSKMKNTTPALEQYLRRCGKSLTLLDLSVTSHNFDESTLAVIAKYCSNLEVLRVANISIGNRSLAHLGRCCPNLKQLNLDGCAKFNDNDLMSLLPKCHMLNHLDLSHSNGLTGKSLMKVEGPITTLTLCNCPHLETKHLVSGLQRMSNSLQSLTISACGNLRSGDVGKLVSAVPNLTSLNLSRCFPQYDPASLAPVGQLSKLVFLNLNLNSAVNDSVLAAIVEGCDNITSINLCGSGGGCSGVLSDRGLSMLARLRKLSDLDISYLDATNNTALINISNRSAQLKRLICRGCPKITDEGSVQVVTMCNNLELFDLSGCNIGDNTVSAALTSVRMRTNNVPLKLVVGGTSVQSVVADRDVPLLTVDLSDFSEEHLRPDFIDDMFFPPSDSDDEGDLGHLCCDCDFEFDDLYDPTLFQFDCDDDDSPKFGVFYDSEDVIQWVDREDEEDRLDLEDELEEEWS